MTVWFATGNVHKKKELADILSNYTVKIPSDAGLDFDPDEKGSTFIENAVLKAQELHRLLEKHRPPLYKRGDPVIADDSGLCVDALNGRPGVHSARYCGMPGFFLSRSLGLSGPNEVPKAEDRAKLLSAAEKNALLLEELGDNPRRTARYVCAMVLYYKTDRFFAAQETMEGELVKSMNSAKGKGGFGFDPIFLIPGLKRTAAELSEAEKNKISHRGKAGKVIARVLDDIKIT